MLTRYFLSTLFCVIISQASAQTGLHDSDTKITWVYFSQDGSKFLTVGYTEKAKKLVAQELVLWDREASLPIWRKTLADFGLTEGDTNHYSFLGRNGSLTRLKLWDDVNKKLYVLNLESFTSQQTINFQVFTFDDQYYIAESYVDEKNKKRKSPKIILQNPTTGERKIVDEYDGTSAALNYSSKDKIIYFKKDFKEKQLINFYDIKTGAYSTLPYKENPNIANTLKEEDVLIQIGYSHFLLEGTGECYYSDYLRLRKSGKYNMRFYEEGGLKKVEMSDLTGYKIAYTLDLNPLTDKTCDDKNSIFVGGDSHLNKTLFTIEKCAFKEHSYVWLSFLREYNRETGKLISEIPLTRLTDQAIAESKTKYEEYRKLKQAQDQYANSPEGKLRKRMMNLYTLYLFSPSTKLIYHVVPDMPLYVGDLVKLTAMHGNKKEEMEVYEKIENVENREMYHVIKDYQQCTPCNGRGYFSNSYQSTAADYQYTTGKKLVRTTTISGACQNCGGCGLVPKN